MAEANINADLDAFFRFMSDPHAPSAIRAEVIPSDAEALFSLQAPSKLATNIASDVFRSEVMSREEALRRVKLGASFLRVCRLFAVVKPRFLEVSHDETALVWYSERKKIARTVVLFRRVSAVMMGQNDFRFKGLSPYFQSEKIQSMSFTIEVFCACMRFLVE